MGDTACVLAELVRCRRDVARCRADGEHTKALELLIRQRDLLQRQAERSTADAKVIAPIVEKIDRDMVRVRGEMRGVTKAENGGKKGELTKIVDSESSRGGAAETRRGTTTATTAAATTTGAVEGDRRSVGAVKSAVPVVKATTTARVVDFKAVDETLAKCASWGPTPPPIVELDEDEDELGPVDLNRQFGGVDAGKGLKRQKPFDPPVVRERKSPSRGRKKQNVRDDEPASRWEGDRDAAVKPPPSRFMSAGERLDLENAAKGLPPAHAQYRAAKEANGATRSYGGRGRGRGGFVPPYGGGAGGGNGQRMKPNQTGNDDEDGPPFSEAVMQKLSPNGEPISEDILKLDREIVERVVSEILDRHESVDWESIAGLEHPKAAVQELAVWPMMNPELFVGARAVPKGLLLFGPPGTGKTLIGRAVASQCGATFFSISASSLTSKWIGEGEKMVRALFAVARHLSPAVIFVDEIDSLLSARKSDGEHESSRRMKTEFLVQMDGLGGGENDRLLLIGATNRPQELDDGARRRMPKQLYIPLPCAAARRDMILRTLSVGKGVAHSLTDADLDMICEKTEGYSGSDMKHLIQEAARAPVRETFQKVKDVPGPVSPSSLRPIVLADVRRAAKQVRPSVTRADVIFHEEWNKQHGALTAGADVDDDESWD